MKFQQLRYLVAVHENGLNMTTAARQLRASQPGVSRQIALLEEELGFQVFERQGRALVVRGQVTAAAAAALARQPRPSVVPPPPRAPAGRRLRPLRWFIAVLLAMPTLTRDANRWRWAGGGIAGGLVAVTAIFVLLDASGLQPTSKGWRVSWRRRASSRKNWRRYAPCNSTSRPSWLSEGAPASAPRSRADLPALSPTR